MTPCPKPIAITVGDRTYKVGALLGSGSRGYEWQCLNEQGLVVRVVHAPTSEVGAATTDGERIEYRWR
jgi:hypothetical protein